MKYRGREIDEATLRLNLWLTQGLVLALAAGSSFFIYGWQSTLALYQTPSRAGMGWAAVVMVTVVFASIAMERYLPRKWQDDGNVNEQIFGRMAPHTTILVCIAVGIGEEWLFRGVIQPLAGNGWTSLIFTLIHVRYLKKPLLVGSVFLTSWLLGMLFSLEGSLWPPIVAHIGIDLLLAFYLQITLRKGKGEGE